MNTNLLIKNFTYAIIGISALVWFILALLNGLNLSKASDFFGLIPKVVTIDLIIFAVFTKWGWKIRWLQGWLVPFPNINGTWIGHTFSDWIDPKTGKKLEPIPTMLTIKQSFFHISCVMHTSEMKSFSYSEGFRIEAYSQIKQLAYAYTSKPILNISERSSTHDGTAVLDIIEKPQYKLKGRYWTERKTSGEIELEYKTGEILEEISADLPKHPMTEAAYRS